MKIINIYYSSSSKINKKYRYEIVLYKMKWFLSGLKIIINYYKVEFKFKRLKLLSVFFYKIQLTVLVISVSVLLYDFSFINIFKSDEIYITDIAISTHEAKTLFHITLVIGFLSQYVTQGINRQSSCFTHFYNFT